MIQALLSWLVLSVAVWLTAQLLPGIHIKRFSGALLVAAVFGILNYLLGWLLFVVIGVATLGLGFLLAFASRWFINAVFLHISAKATQAIKIDSFGWTLVGAAVMAGLGTVGEWILGRLL